MNASFVKSRMGIAVLSSLLAATFSLSAHATLYPEGPFNNSGPIPLGATTTFSAEQTISGIATSISSIELVLTFNDSVDLTGNSSGIQGSLNLGTGTGSPYISFYPTATSSSGAEQIYDATFSNLNGDNPNNTWALVLWDNGGSGIENGLVSWSLDITAVPEPIHVALGIFAGLAVLWFCLGLCWRKPRARQEEPAELETQKANL